MVTAHTFMHFLASPAQSWGSRVSCSRTLPRKKKKKIPEEPRIRESNVLLHCAIPDRLGYAELFNPKSGFEIETYIVTRGKCLITGLIMSLWPKYGQVVGISVLSVKSGINLLSSKVTKYVACRPKGNKSQSFN